MARFSTQNHRIGSVKIPMDRMINQYKQNQAAQLRQSDFQLRPSAIIGLLHSSTPFNPNDVILDAEVSVVEDNVIPDFSENYIETLETSEPTVLVPPRPAEKDN